MANTIASERKRIGLTQSELGEKLGKDRSTISRWESDPSILTGESLSQLSDLFGCTTDYLLGRSEERVPKAVV